MARTDYGAILSTRIADTSQAIRDVNSTSGLIAPADWGTLIRAMKSQADYQNALEQMIEETASGAIASFTDGANNIPVKSLIAQIVPVQDLHGYDHPWTGGAGKNKINAPNVTFSSGSYLYNDALALPAGTYTLSFTSSSGASMSASISITDADGTAMVSGSHVIPYTFTLPNASAIVKIYVPGAGTYTNIQIEQGSTATSYEPYENICPITGWSACKVARTGKNLWDDSIYESAGWTLQENGYYNGNAHALMRNSKYSTSQGGIKTNGVVTISFDTLITSGAFQVYCLYKNSTAWTNLSGNIHSSGLKEFTTDATRECVAIGLYTTAGESSSAFSLKNVQVEINDTATDYLPYTGETKTIDFGQTVYGGSLNFTTGLLTIIRGMIESYDGESIGTPWICDRTVYEEGTTPPTGSQVVYPLAEPITIQLTPTEVKTLLGDNNIWADTGDVTVTYRANGNLYVAQH